ncbi:MAG: hypothetical protein ACW981_03705 [Candidatus Hodarchaeales archaeon]|jgi:hypothetical protein
MSQTDNKIVEKWLNGKFDAKVTISLVQRGNFLNPGISLIKGREYNTKLGPAMSVQLGYNEIQDMIETLQLIQEKMKVSFSAQKNITEE